MARPWEATFIRLWQAGASQAEIAAALGIPLGTMKSRGHRLVAQGKLQPRPRQSRQAPREGPEGLAAEGPAAGLHPTVPTRHPQVQHETTRHGAAQQAWRTLVEEALRPVLARLTALEAEVQARRAQREGPSGLGAAPGGAGSTLPRAEPADLPPEARKSERWNLYLPRWVRQAVEAEAAAHQRAPSWVLQAIVRQWLAAREGP
jgi:hypothetical protein